jgi:hypothetical protein
LFAKLRIREFLRGRIRQYQGKPNANVTVSPLGVVVSKTKCRMVDVSLVVLGVVRFFKKLKKRLFVKRQWDKIFNNRLCVIPSFKLRLIPGEKDWDKIRCCDFCSRLYEINFRKTDLKIKNRGRHFVPFSYILHRRKMALRIVKFIMKFKRSRTRVYSYRRLLSDETTAL